MKKNFLLSLSCFLCLVMVARAQDFEPGQQAQGYLNSKNVVVDHSTGIFHYKVPLFTIKSGNYQLPLTLDYSSNGVKKEDQPGVIGYNWTLGTGGVVTRTVRGGVADDDSQFGYACLAGNPASIPLENDISNVQRVRDGECDIFTAVFNGQVVRFIIKVSFPFKITAEPLEQTNVSIECVTRGSEIYGWIITDEFGNKYIYNQKEWTTNLYREDAISLNGIRNKFYVSSWYLNRIEPQNGEPIVFDYMVDKPNISYYEYISKSKFFYGRPMIERPFDFEYCRFDFESAINRACFYLQNYSFEQQLVHKYGIMVNNLYWVVNPRFEEEGAAIDYNFRIMGQLGEFTKVGQLSREMIQMLNELHDMYDKSTSFNAKMAALCFWDAKDILIQCLNETFPVEHKEVENITTYRISSPMLSSINCLDQEVRFEYNQGKLIKIKSYDMLKNIKSETRLSTRTTGLLDRVSFIDKSENEIEYIRFDYYMLPSSTNLAWDIWGYHRDPSNVESSVNVEFARKYSLKDITWSKGGNVRVEYESNRVFDKVYPFEEAEEYGSYYGGLRLKSLVYSSDKDARTDTVFYRYPLSGKLVYNGYMPKECIGYGSFSDMVEYDRVRFTGVAFMNTGNNGIYYPIVREEIKGRGSKTYLFNVPSLPLDPDFSTPYEFWLNGIPLATASYDETGNLKQIVKNRYYEGVFPLNMEYFEMGNSANLYTKSLPQVKAYEYYMDEPVLRSQYESQGRIFLYTDYYSDVYFDPYQEIFSKNIGPRLGVILPEQVYTLAYGGKTLLKEQLVYQFEGQVTASPGINDFSLYTKGTPFQRIEYGYDHPGISVSPTWESFTDAKGNDYKKYSLRVVDMLSSSSRWIAKMKEHNMLQPVVKELIFKNGILQQETVYKYEYHETEGANSVVLSGVYVYEENGQTRYNDNTVRSRIFTLDSSLYQERERYSYTRSGMICFPNTKTTRDETTGYFYDFESQRLLLNASQESPGSIAALDLRPLADPSFSSNNVRWDLELCRIYEKVYAGLQNFDCKNESPEFQAYTKTRGHELVMETFRLLGTSTSVSDLGKIGALLDSMRWNEGYYMEEFSNYYTYIWDRYPELNISYEDIGSAVINLSIPGLLSMNFFRCMYSSRSRLNVVPGSKYLKLYALNQGGNIKCDITHSGGKSVVNVALKNSSLFNIQVRDLDLSAYSEVTSVTFTVDPELIYLCVVPADTRFEATSYNLDGTVFCKFDQNGNMELNEYDAAGRVVRVKDQDGNTIKENVYNILK